MRRLIRAGIASLAARTPRVRRQVDRTREVSEPHTPEAQDQEASARTREATPPFVVRERVRWSDVDAAGIVCYGMYLRFFELAETELFRAAGLPPSALSGTHGIWLVRRHVECDFLRPVFLDQEMDVSARVTGIGRTSLEMGFHAVRVEDRALVATGRYVLVAVDREQLRAVKVPAAIRAALGRVGAAGVEG